MHRLKHKLSGRAGSSMILALVFLLFSVFVGGSVLTAATVNANRIKNDSDQQAYLDERSSAYLIADLLKCDPDKLPEMTIITETITTIRSGNPKIETHTTISIPDSEENLNTMHNLLYQSAVFRYIAKQHETPGKTVNVAVKHKVNSVGANVHLDRAETKITNATDLNKMNYWACKDGNSYEDCTKCELKLTESRKKIPECHLITECTGGTDLTLYDFDVHLKSKDHMAVHSDSQLRVHMDASVSSSEVTRLPVQIKSDGTRIETEISSMNVYWENPIIMKGGSGK